MRREGKNVALTFSEMDRKKSCVVLFVKKVPETDDKKSIAKIFNYHQRGRKLIENLFLLTLFYFQIILQWFISP